MHPKKVLPKKPIFLGLSIRKIVFWLKLFLGALFTKVTCTFLKSVRKARFFDAPFDLFKEKKFSSLRRDSELFESWKRSKMEETAKNFEKRFFINRSSDFHCPSKILCYTSNLWNFVKITGTYCTQGDPGGGPGGRGLCWGVLEGCKTAVTPACGLLGFSWSATQGSHTRTQNQWHVGKRRY